MPSEGARKSIGEELSKREGGGVIIVEATFTRQDGHSVACGLYRKKEQHEVRPFGWVDGKLVMQWGPVWNPATRCLVDHYNMPLP